jgi:hypothetical protein
MIFHDFVKKMYFVCYLYIENAGKMIVSGEKNMLLINNLGGIFYEITAFSGIYRGVYIIEMRLVAPNNNNNNTKTNERKNR